jgi:hypothetical protein
MHLEAYEAAPESNLGGTLFSRSGKKDSKKRRSFIVIFLRPLAYTPAP